MADLRGILPGPFAGPGTQKEYEAALGRFLVAFNRIDNDLRRIVAKLLEDQGRQTLWHQVRGDYYQRHLINLQLLSHGLDWFPDLPYDRLNALNATRNHLAHGHYDQDLFSDNFEIVGKNKRQSATIEDVKVSIEEALDLASDVEAVWAHIWFEPPEE